MANKKERVMIVDGYNVLNAQMPGLTGRSIGDARDALVEKLRDYAGYSGQKVIVVFDAWQSDRQKRTTEDMGNLSVVFTRHGETADHYIERICEQYAQRARLGRMELRVATSDFVEQTVVMGRGAVRVSARELLSEIEQMRQMGKKAAVEKQISRSTVMERLPDEVRLKLEKMRRGE